MELIKPEPLILGGVAHYTLSSYDPVQVEVRVPRITQEDVDYAYVMLIMQAGGEPEDTTNDVWVQKTFGAPGAMALHKAVEAQVREANDHMVQNQKATACANALADRLQQRVPPQRVAQIRSSLVREFASDLAADGMSEADFLASGGLRHSDLEHMFDEQARTSAHHEAALLAWAEERKVAVEDDEIPRLLGMPEDQADQIMAEVKASNTPALSEMRQAALQAKAIGMVMAECECTYVHETAEEAAQRVANMRQQMDAQTTGQATDEDASSDGPHLKLV